MKNCWFWRPSIDDQLGYYTRAAKLYGQLTMIDPIKLNYQVGQAMAIDHAGDIDTATNSVPNDFTKTGRLWREALHL